MKLIDEIRKIHPSQPSTVAAMLLSLRARFELRSGIQNRIGRMFEGNRGVLFVGKAGVGKTRFMKAVWDGLNLAGINGQGQVVGKWLPSTGGSTGKGMYEVLEVYNDSIIFADELSLDTDMHVHTMKQIANGELCRPKFGSIESTPFNGLLIGATNAIKLPSNSRELEHLLATLDRFMVVNVKTTNRTPSETLELVLADEKPANVSWAEIAQALRRKSSANLNKAETQALRSMWEEKSREILDPTRAQFRNAHTMLDIWLFCKRFFGVKSIVEDKAVFEFVQEMVNDCILFNPVGLLWLSPLEQIIYDTVKSKDVVSTSEIIGAVTGAGITVSRMTIARTINRMLESYLITKVTHGKYSTKTGSSVTYNKVESETSPADCIEPVVAKEVMDLVNDL